MHLRGTFYGTLIFQQSSMICISLFQAQFSGPSYLGAWNRLDFVLAAMLEDILLPSNVAAKTTFCLYLVKRLRVTMYAQLCWKLYHIIFPTISLKFMCKIYVQKEIIHRFKNHTLVMWPATNLLKKMVRVWKTKSLCLRYDPIMVFWRQYHLTFIFIKMMSHCLLNIHKHT